MPAALTPGLRRVAREAGLLYLAVALLAPPIYLHLPREFVVSGDALATAERLRLREGLFRGVIAASLVLKVVWLFLVLALHRLLREVGPTDARRMVILGALVPVPMAFLNVLPQLAALTLAKGPAVFAGLDGGYRDALAYLFLNLHDQGDNMVSLFWGLWLFPFGRLAVRSGFMPRAVGVLLMVAGVSYVAGSLTTIVAPALARRLQGILMALAFGEIPVIVWLLIAGARKERTA